MAASHVTGDVWWPVAMSATDQASTTAAMPLATHQLSRRPDTTMAVPMARTPASEKVAVQKITGGTGFPGSWRDASTPTMAPTTPEANDMNRSCLMAGPRTTASWGTGASSSCCTTGASSVSGPPRPPDRSPKATAAAITSPRMAGPWSASLSRLDADSLSSATLLDANSTKMMPPRAVR